MVSSISLQHGAGLQSEQSLPFTSTRMVGGPSRIGLFSGKVTQTHSVCFKSTDCHLADSQYSTLLSIRHRLRAILCGSSTCRNWLSDADRKLPNLCATSVTHRHSDTRSWNQSTLYSDTSIISLFFDASLPIAWRLLSSAIHAAIRTTFYIWLATAATAKLPSACQGSANPLSGFASSSV